MPILFADDITWHPAPRCPVCGAGITPTGTRMPIAVDASGRVYCREHGSRVEPTYADELADYMAWRARRSEAIEALHADALQGRPAAS
jgi:hypothetical protein